MYAVANVEKFVKDKQLGEKGEKIIKRANALANNGVVSGGSILEIMGSHKLEQEFHETAMSDPEHLRIGNEAIKKLIQDA